MNRTRRFLDGVLLSYGNQGLVMLVGLWLTPFLLHHLGQHDYGVWLVGLQSLTYLTLLDIGVIGLLPREVAFVSGRVHQGASPEELRTLLEENAIVILWQTPIVVVAVTIAWFVMSHQGFGFRGVLLIILATYCIQFPLRLFFAALEGLQDFGFLGYLQICAWAAGVIVNVSSVVLGKGLYGLAYGWVVTQAVVTFGCIWRIYAAFGHFGPRRLRWLPWSKIRGYLRSGFWVSVSQVTQLLIKGVDVVLLAAASGPAAVVPYSCSTKLQSVLANQPQVILQAAQPGLTQLRATADRAHLGRVIGTLAQAMLMLSGAVGMVVIAVNQGFVTRWVGPKQYLGFWFSVLISIGMLLRHLNTTSVYSLFCFGRERFISIVGFADSVCFAVLTFVFLRWFGVIGIPLASIGSVLLVSLPLNFRELRRVTGESMARQFGPVREWLIPFAILALLVGIAGQFYQPSSYPMCAVVLAVVMALYVLIELPVIQRSLWGEKLKSALGQPFSRLAARFGKSSSVSVS
jgi:O-antigen/teichoic acid export membrane protein